MKARDEYYNLKQQLSGIYEGSEAAVIAGWVMEHYTGLSLQDLKLKPDIAISIRETFDINKALDQLLLHRPIQYVLGEAWFMGNKFYVNEAVLIPRPETEELVNEGLNFLKKITPSNDTIEVLDIGAGSGCIAISIKKNMAKILATAVDISEAALDIARHNASSLQAEIDFVQLDFLDESSWDTLGKYDLIISNPPYIPHHEQEHLDNNVTAWEPSLALFVPDEDPLLFYRATASFGKKYLKKDGVLFFECHQHFAVSTQQMLEENDYQTVLIKDIHGNDRIIKAWIDK